MGKNLKIARARAAPMSLDIPCRNGIGESDMVTARGEPPAPGALRAGVERAILGACQKP